ncbi:MAG: methylated-DNA--[protein]-cysteine S-methyltransferase [Vicinamibacterales bacterium]
MNDKPNAKKKLANRPSVRFGSLETPIGPVFVASSNSGLFDVAFGVTDQVRYVARLGTRVERALPDQRAVSGVLDQLDDYFCGNVTRFNIPIDLRVSTDFTYRVLCTASQIPFGQTMSYGEISKIIASPGASRAVGGALGRNPIPIVIPCHRVIAGDGRIGGFTGGLAIKKALLRLEGHLVR